MFLTSRLRLIAACGRQPGRNLGLSAYDVELIKSCVAERPSAPLIKIAEFLEFAIGSRVSVAIIHRVLRGRLRFSHKLGTESLWSVARLRRTFIIEDHPDLKCFMQVLARSHESHVLGSRGFTDPNVGVLKHLHAHFHCIRGFFLPKGMKTPSSR